MAPPSPSWPTTTGKWPPSTAGSSTARCDGIWPCSGYALYRARVLQENGPLEARIIEPQSPLNSRDSGGPLVNDRGELVGVVASAGKQSRLVSFNVDVTEVTQLSSAAPELGVHGR